MANFKPKFEYEDPISGTTTITLSLPPEGDPKNERFRTNGRETRSSSGKHQYQFNYTDHVFDIRLTFLTQTQIDAIKDLFDDCSFSINIA